MDPQGKTVTKAMTNIGLPEIADVRIGKHIQLSVEAPDEKTARSKVEEACQKLLINQITEYYQFSLHQDEE